MNKAKPGDVMVQRAGQWVWEPAPPVQTYEEWKRTTGVTEGDERKFMEGRAKWSEPQCPACRASVSVCRCRGEGRG